MRELLRLKRFWIAVALVAVVIVNRFTGPEGSWVDAAASTLAAVLGTSAGLRAGKEAENADD